MTLIEELRSKKSRDNRDLLDRAADRIEELELALKRNKLPSTLTNEEKVSEKFFSPEEVRKMTPKEVKENYDLIIQSMKRW